MNKKKIINDPIYGFITIPNELVYDIIEHPYFQRLRRIRQLGISDLVYPGATHSRFHHALGAMHLMGRALSSLRTKGHDISDEEFDAAQIAILCHDLGHGPFSHSLEYNLFPGISHEELSLKMLESLNDEFSGLLDLAIKIFIGKYSRKFLNQLVSSQLDIDRLDYLTRDSFYTGVHEGTIGSERIIKMLDLVNDELVIEEKGIYSVENFLNARRLMYWQVYLHKAAVSADVMLGETLTRVRSLIQSGRLVTCTPALEYLMGIEQEKAIDQETLKFFTQLDDNDILGSMKFWVRSDDFILRYLSSQILSRRLFKIKLGNDKPDKDLVKEIRSKAIRNFQVSQEESKILVKKGSVSNAAYLSRDQTINILTKKGVVLDVATATDLPNIRAISKIVKKHYLCYPKELDLQIN